MTKRAQSSDDDAPTAADRKAEWMEFVLEVIFAGCLLAAVWMRTAQFVETAGVALALIRLGHRYDYERMMIGEAAALVRLIVLAAFDRLPPGLPRIETVSPLVRASWSAGVYFRRRWAIITSSGFMKRS